MIYALRQKPFPETARTWLAQLLQAVKEQPTYAADASQLAYIESQMDAKRDHEIMCTAWADIQASNPNPDDKGWSLPRYSHEVCQLLTAYPASVGLVS